MVEVVSEPVSEVVSEVVEAVPAPPLARYVSSYTGYRISGLRPGVHAGLPSRSLTLIIAFDEPLDLAAQPDPSQPPGRFTTMLAGLHAAPAIVRHQGRQHGIQLELTPRGALALFGLRPGDLAGRAEQLDQIDQVFGRTLVERLGEAAGWPERFEILDSMLCGQIRDVAGFGPELDGAWHLIVGSRGRMGVTEVADSVAWSRRHLSERFRRTFGLASKRLANVVRFERAQHLLRGPARPALADVAATCGYADQAHMTRQWHEFAGSSPSAWLGDELLPFVQDDPATAPAR